LFSKFFPVIAVAEIKHILKRSGDSYKEHMGKEEMESYDAFEHEQSHSHH